MALNDENIVMPVTPMGNSGGFGGFADGNGFWIILLFILLGGWGGGFGGGFGGGALANDAAVMYPWMNQSNQISDGFRDQMLNTTINGIQQGITAGFGDVQLGIAGINQNLCQTGNGIVNAVTNGFNQAEIAANARQMADMQQNFAAQTATLQGFNGIQSQLAQCCCDNRMATVQTQNTVASEGAATRLAIQQQTQAILDKMCQQEIDTLKAQNLALQNQVNMQNLAASQVAQTAALVADNTAQTQYIVNRVAPYPIPAYTVANPVTPAA